MDETAITIYQRQAVDVPASREDATVEKWLDAKTNKSAKTKAAYTLVMRQFRAHLGQHGLDVFDDDVAVSYLASEYAKTNYPRPGWPAVNQVSENTINQRLAILSSFYRYAMKYRAARENPILLCERESRNVHDAAQHLEADDVVEALSAIETKTLSGKRDYALLALAVTTGRRAAELTALTWGDIRLTGKKWEVTWRACKGNKTMQDILGTKTRGALETYLHALYGKHLGQLANDAPLFVSLSRNNYGRAMSVQAVSDICQKHLGTSKVHTTRHTFAVNSERAGASLSEISERLGHSNEKVTSDYLKRRHSAENRTIGTLESLYGL